MNAPVTHGGAWAGGLLFGLLLLWPARALAGPEPAREAMVIVDAAWLDDAPRPAAREDPALAGWLEVVAVRAAIAEATGGDALEDLLGRVEALPARHPARSGLGVALARGLLKALSPGTPLESRRVDRLLALLGRARTPEAQAVAAHLLERSGRRDEANAAQGGLLARAPASAEARALARARPELVNGLEVAGRLDRIEGLLAGNFAGLAIPEGLQLRASAELGEEEACRLALLLGRAHRLERNYHQAIDELEGFGLRCPEDAQARREAAWLLASATSIALGDPAIALYQRYIQDHPGDPRGDDALFFVADLHRLAGRPDEAARTLRRLLARHGGGDFALKAAWRLARRHLLEQTGDPRRPGKAMIALQRYERLARRRGSRMDLDRAHTARAWLLLDASEGKAAASRRARKIALPLLRAVARARPFSFHGNLARALLRRYAPQVAARTEATIEGDLRPEGAGDPGGQAHFPPTRVSAAFLQRDALRVARALISMKQAGVALEVLAPLAKRVRSSGEVLVTAALLSRAGGMRQAQLLLRRRARKVMGERPTEAARWIWETAYPRAYRARIEKACASVGIEADLLQAIIREESALDPLARSWAGAVGLAQLMPATAADTGRRMGLSRPVTPQALLQPELNLKVACRYLSDLRAQVGPRTPLVVAAYNAGARSIEGWREATPGLPLPFFVENLGYAETRRYTRRVLRTLAIYRFLYPGRADPLSPISLAPVLADPNDAPP